MNDKKIALITGSSRGLGRAIAMKLSKENFLMIINCKKSIREANNVKSEIKKRGYIANVIIGDITKKSECKRIIKVICERYGGLDVLINNAGIYKKREKMSEEDEIELFKLKIPSIINMMDEAISAKVKSIINISSIYGIIPSFSSPIVSALQSAVINITRNYAKQFIGKIQINSIAPGWMNTTMVTTNYSEDQLRKVLNEKVPIKRLVEPEEVEENASFIIQNPLITGQTFIIDGGYHLVN